MIEYLKPRIFAMNEPRKEPMHREKYKQMRE
jgi:hypothetical protein